MAQQSIKVSYRGVTFVGRRVDLVVENLVVVELKSVDGLAALHLSQMVSYLRATKLRVGIVLNFNTVRMKDGIRRIVL